MFEEWEKEWGYQEQLSLEILEVKFKAQKEKQWEWSVAQRQKTLVKCNKILSTNFACKFGSLI